MLPSDLCAKESLTNRVTAINMTTNYKTATQTIKELDLQHEEDRSIWIMMAPGAPITACSLLICAPSSGWA